MTSWTINPIGILEGPFKEKFGTPRQPLLTPYIRGRIKLLPPYNKREAFEGLEGFSHLWLQFGFHLNQREEFAPKIRPPRLGGNKKVGVFASRSSFRPNSLGLSVVKNEGLRENSGELFLEIAGQDLVHGTPIFDIKPYLPSYDSIPQALSGWMGAKDFPTFEVAWSQEALAQLDCCQNPAELKNSIDQILALGPMPSYQIDGAKEYGMSFDHFNIRFTHSQQKLTIISLKVL